MKKIFFVIVLFVFMSCSLNKTKQQPMRERINLKTYENFIKNKYKDLVYMPGFDDRGGFCYIYRPKSFIREFKEYNSEGYLVEKSVFIGGVKIEKSEYYDKKGNLKIVDEEAKFGKIKPIDALKFLEKKGVINLKTGEGRFNKRGGTRTSFELHFRSYDNRSDNLWDSCVKNGYFEKFGKKFFVIIIVEALPMSKDVFTYLQYMDDVYFMNGETGEVKDKKGRVVIFEDDLHKKPYKTYEGKEYTKKVLPQ